MAESKSGTTAASVMMNSCRFLRRILQFWGSSAESVGCGHSTFAPSSDSFNRAAMVAPSSIFASLKNAKMMSLRDLIVWRTNVRWINNQTASMSLVKWVKINLWGFIVTILSPRFLFGHDEQTYDYGLTRALNAYERTYTVDSYTRAADHGIIWKLPNKGRR